MNACVKFYDQNNDLLDLTIPSCELEIQGNSIVNADSVSRYYSGSQATLTWFSIARHERSKKLLHRGKVDRPQLITAGATVVFTPGAISLSLVPSTEPEAVDDGGVLQRHR
jgi:hypothetical protein